MINASRSSITITVLLAFVLQQVIGGGFELGLPRNEASPQAPSEAQNNGTPLPSLDRFIMRNTIL